MITTRRKNDRGLEDLMRSQTLSVNIQLSGLRAIVIFLY